MKDLRKIIRQTLNEFITPRDLKSVENYADELFSDVGVDVEFTRHFLDRVNDLRNKQDITPEELKWLYQKAHDKYATMISKLNPGEERVLTDPDTQINIPFAMGWDGRSPDKDMVGKTIMRKKDFKSYTPKLTLEKSIDKKPKVKLSDLYVEADNMLDAYYKSKNSLGPSSRSSEHPLYINKLLDGSLLLMDGHHRIADRIKYLKLNNIEDILNLTFEVTINNENYKDLESFPDGEYWISFMDWAYSMEKEFAIQEDINVPINVGDEVLGGKFKNKKITVKSIGKNEKGDITINDKPLLRFRITKESNEPKENLKDVNTEFEKIKNSHFNTLKDLTLNDIVNNWNEVKSIKNDNIDTINFFINKIKNNEDIDCLIYDKKGIADGFHRLIAMKITGIKQFCFIYDENFLG